MDFVKYFVSVSTVLLIEKSLLICCDGFEHIEITPPQVTVNVGEKIEVHCKTRVNFIQRYTLQWETIDGSKEFEDHMSTLLITSARIQDAGHYRCVYKDDTGKTSSKTLQVIVLWDNDEVTDPVPKETVEDDDDQMIWLKTTVYTVIACTVGIVLLISVVVIAIFRIKMKRAAVRRAMRQAERRRRHSSRCDTQGSHHSSSRTRRNDTHEHEPFISAPSPTHFGNIIVNVNNGVQYVPNTEFNSVVQSPPSYADVVAESGVVIVGRHSPPPEYSTLDKNPNRLSDASMTVSQSYNQNLAENQITNTNVSEQGRSNYQRNSDNVEVGHSCRNDLQLFETGNGTLNNQSANNSQTLSHMPSGSVTETNSLGRRNRRGHCSRQTRNVRSVGSPRRPKQLKVCDGQIVLDESSSNSSSPDTINRNTQTNPADINPANQTAAKPAQIQVQGGQIILANEEGADSQRAEPDMTDEEGAQGQGQLEVKDGQIVFKSSGT